MTNCVVCLMGPTAAGKTAAAMALADALPVMLISVDSAQVYRHMDIGTGKPSAAELRQYPHALVDITDPEQIYSAALFAEDAKVAVLAAWEQNKIPVMVGGTGLYYRAFLGGLTQLPKADPQLRAELERDAELHGRAALHQRLAELDPVSAKRLHPHDLQRIQRALEVCLLAGRPMSELTAQDSEKGFQAPTLKLVVAPGERAQLHARIERRFAGMLESGLVDEVAMLQRRPGIHADLPSMRSVGYRQTWEHLAGDFGLQELHTRGVIATRQLARRQLTWLRAETGTEWHNSQETTHIADMVARVQRFMDGR
jgi:tRNA dimethylallyltransferase